jgi:hypothetical protein
MIDNDYDRRKAYILLRELSPWSARKEKHLRRSLKIVAYADAHGARAAAQRFGVTRARVYQHMRRHQRQVG